MYAKDTWYENFYKEELLYRNLGGYPPVSDMLMVQIYEKEEQAGVFWGKKMKEYLKEYAFANRMTIIGPANAGISKISDVYRSCLILKHKDKNVLKEAKTRLEQFLGTCGIEGKIVQFDFNPMNSF